MNGESPYMRAPSSSRPLRPRRPSWRTVPASLAITAITVLVVAYGILPAVRATAIARPPRTTVARSPDDFGLPAEDVTFTTTRGEAMRAWYAPPANGAVVVIAHGFGDSGASLLEPARWLQDYGYGVLVVDLVAHGRSGGSALALDGRDVRAAVRFLRGRGVAAGRIGLWGMSLGGMESLQAAAQEPNVGAVVADGPFPVVAGADMPRPRGWRDRLWIPFDTVQRAALRVRDVAPAMGAIEALQRIAPRPVLLIAGLRNAGEAWVVPHYAAAAAAEGGGSGPRLWSVPEAGHVQSLGARREEYLYRILTLFDTALAQGDPTDAAADIRRHSLAAMAAVATWTQEVTVETNRPDGSYSQQRTTYRHELPDRHAIRVDATDVGADGTVTHAERSEAIRIRVHYWTRRGGFGPYDCEPDDWTPEVLPTAFVPGRAARLVEHEDAATGRNGREAFRLVDDGPPASTSGPTAPRSTAAGSGSAPTVTSWIDAATFRVLRQARTTTNADGSVEEEVRRLSGFNTVSRVFVPADMQEKSPCAGTSD